MHTSILISYRVCIYSFFYVHLQLERRYTMVCFGNATAARINSDCVRNDVSFSRYFENSCNSRVLGVAVRNTSNSYDLWKTFTNCNLRLRRITYALSMLIASDNYAIFIMKKFLFVQDLFKFFLSAVHYLISLDCLRLRIKC